MVQVAWTPDPSVMGLGTVLLPQRPTTPLGREEYEAALIRRLDRMAEDLEPRALADEVALAFQMEGLTPSRGAVGQTMVMWSPELRRKSGLLTQTWPAPMKGVRFSRAEARDLEEVEMDLSEYLALLYWNPRP